MARKYARRRARWLELGRACSLRPVGRAKRMQGSSLPLLVQSGRLSAADETLASRAKRERPLPRKPGSFEGFVRIQVAPDPNCLRVLSSDQPGHWRVDLDTASGA